MTAPARYSSSTSPDYSDYYSASAVDSDAHWVVAPGERIGPPPPRSYGRIVFSGLVLMASIAGGSWAMLGEPTLVKEWRQTITSVVTEAMERAAPLQAAQPQQPASPPPLVEAPPLQKAEIPVPPAAARLVETAEPRPPVVAALIAPAVEPPAAAPPTPAPPKEPLDAWQRRAAAVGLNPDLSRVLLSRLSETDYRNAGIAIRNALAESNDDAVTVWPKQRKAEQALFTVGFVAGAGPGCRRYVVTIAKDGWLTTALPMERCEAKPTQPKKATASR